MTRRLLRVCAALCVSLFVVALGASAQPRARVRVIDDDATIWRSRTGGMIVVVKAGTNLEVVSEQGDWFEVVVPGGSGDTKTGFVQAASVARIVPGAPAPALRPSRRPPITAPARERAGSSPARLRGFFQIGGGQFSASQTFDAVLGDHGGLWLGGGAQVQLWRGLFGQVAAEHFSKTGQRVFVHDGDVFKLGIPDTVSVTPVEFTAGFGANWRPGLRPYGGGGFGHYSFSEESTIAGETDRVSRSANGYHLLGGLEWRAWRWTSAAFEVQHRWVPDAFDAGTAAMFEEDDLGGFQVRGKILIGW